MKRRLTSVEINDILSFIKPRTDIPHDTAMTIVNANRKQMEQELSEAEIYPSIIPELKMEIIRQYRKSLIQPGESVGIVCAQSIGEMQTQTTLNTFHKAGQSEKTMTSGVPRFRELIDATKNPKIVNNIIFFNEGNSNIQEIRNTVGHTITGFTLKCISEKSSIYLNKQEETWYDSYKILFSDNFTTYDHCISYKMNMKKLFEFKLTLKYICDFIENEYEDLCCVFSPPCNGQIDIFVDTTNIVLPEDRLLFMDTDNAIMIYLEECVQTTLESIYICGIPAITEVFYSKSDNNEWIVETNGFNSKKITKQYSSFKKLLAHPSVDYTRTISNNVWDIYEVLDIEAARQFLIEEFTEIMNGGVNICHTMLLVDRMTHAGTISSITRYTLKADESGPMGKASFEETMDNFLDAASQGQCEPTKGVSASIICGKRANIGTGMIKTTIDINNLPIVESFSDSDRDSDNEDSESDILTEKFAEIEL